VFIYLVRSGGLLTHADPVAAFTDTAVLAGWLRAKTPESRALLSLYRMNDGGIGAVVEISINDILHDNPKEGQ
jgi:hypothetical protein